MNFLPYLGPWCCEKGKFLGVVICPECAKINERYAMTPCEQFPELFGKDFWFDKYCADKVTHDFAIWWLEWYGAPTDFDSTLDEQHEYFKRCGFALNGWIARR